jgi:hypothetical protein
MTTGPMTDAEALCLPVYFQTPYSIVLVHTSRLMGSPRRVRNGEIFLSFIEEGPELAAHCHHHVADTVGGAIRVQLKRTKLVH